MFQAFLASIFGGGADVTNKYLLGRLKLSHKDYLPFIFALLSIVALFLVPIHFHFSNEAFSFKYIILLLIMIAAAACWNSLLAKSLQTEPLHEYESIILLTPLATVVLATVFLPVERNIHVFIAGLISSLAVAITHFRHNHLELTKTARHTILAVLLIAVESVCIRPLLNFYSPALLYAIRVIILTIVFFITFKPDFRVLSVKPVIRGLILDSFLGAGVMVLKYTAFAKIGVVETTIFLLLSPLIAFIASYFYFGEHRNFKRDITCAVVIIACIIYASLAR